MIGYVYGNLNELVLENDGDLPQVIKAWFAQGRANAADVAVPPYDRERIAFFSHLCESMSVNPVERVRVLNWEKILQVMLQFKHEYCPLQDGEVEFGVENEAFRMKVHGGKVSVDKVGELDSLTEITRETIPTYTQNEAEMLFFGLQNTLTPQAAYKNWLPIPFFVDTPDKF